ncbi:LOB domain-containing protein 1 [Vitis vinifera]|uniref:LOB domain-containing protein 1 n=1 Tax=Vitis vinifera TaxID=29760 RepID=A0A438FLB6_VITVI|nr:LOB domain-containing protein 1 [Vitis vinifera]
MEYADIDKTTRPLAVSCIPFSSSSPYSSRFSPPPTAFQVFGASNIAKALQELPQPTRADAVSSMVYEANARIRDPVYGCAATAAKCEDKLLPGHKFNLRLLLINLIGNKEGVLHRS